MTYFVVTETNFEYNDEYHTVVDGGGGKPVAVFENEEDAKKDATKRSVKVIKDYEDMIAGFVYGYGFDWTFKTLPSFFDDNKEYEYSDIETALDLKNRTHEQLVELESCLNVKFFTYIKVES